MRVSSWRFRLRPRAQTVPQEDRLPNGWQPEGIAIGRGTNAYVGSIPTGRVWRANLRTGQGSVLVPDRGRQATGVDVDQRNRLFVAGGPTGGGFVYNARNGDDIAQYSFAAAGSFVNDVVVTKRAAWFTDSFLQFVYKVPIGHNGRLGAAVAVPLTGDIVYEANFNANGIDATPNGRTLLIVQRTPASSSRSTGKASRTRSSYRAGRALPVTESCCTAGRCTSCAAS